MNSLEMFQMALQLPSPRFVKSINSKEEAENKKVLHIDIGFTKGHVSEEGKKTHDTKERSWHHLNFFEHECYLTCQVPCLRDSEGKAAMVEVSWARKGIGFTLLSEAMSMALIAQLPAIGQAYRLKTLSGDFWDFAHPEEGSAFLACRCDLAEEERLFPFRKFIQTLKAHWSGIVNYLNSQIAKGIIEGINSKIQLAKRRAGGHKNITNFIHMIDFIAGKLKVNYPHYST